MSPCAGDTGAVELNVVVAGTGSPVNCDPLPMKKLPEILAVVVTLPAKLAKLPVYVGKYAATLAFEYDSGKPVS
jgi:hypothetical protein